MRATDPDGTTWTVRRRWLPWRRRIHNPHAGDLDFVTGAGDDPVGIVLSVIGLVLAIPAIVLGLLVTLEFLALLALFPLVLLGRVLLGRHWTVVVRRRRELWSEADGGDWQASGLLVHDLAASIERGDLPSRTSPAATDPPPSG